MRAPWLLVASSVGLIGFMALFVPWVTARHGFAGYGLAMLIYWFAFCLPLGLVFAGRGVLSFRLNGQAWVPWVVTALVVVVLFATLARLPGGLTSLVVALALAAGLINGPLEELYWRGGYLAQFGHSLPGFALGWALFVAWHLPLAMAAGVVYQGGGLALVGGAAGMGLFWAVIVWRTRGIGWAMVSHAAINMIVFHALIADNL